MAKAKKQTAWVGWIYFAALLMLLNGVLSILAGISGIFANTQLFVSGSEAWVVNFETWGWIQLILGVLVFSAGVSLLRGHTYGRVYAIFATFLGALVSLMYIPVYPFWGLVAMVLYILTMYAVVVHGNELEEL